MSTKINFFNQNLIFKTLLYRLLGSILVFFLSYFFTDNMMISIGIGGIEFILKTIMYYVYEIIWKKIEKETI